MRNKISIGLLFGCAALLNAAAGEFTPEAYPLVKTARLGEPRPARYSAYAINIDAEMYRSLDDDFANLRVATPDGTQIPFVVRDNPSWQIVRHYRPLKGKIVSFRYDEKSNCAVIGYEVAPPAGQRAARVGKLEIVPAGQRSFDKKVTLRFDDGSTESDLEFFNHAKNIDFSCHAFEFTPRPARHIDIEITPFAERRVANGVLEHQGRNDSFTETRLTTDELAIDRITFQDAHDETRPLPAPVKLQPLRELGRRTARQVTQIEFDAGRIPLRMVRITSATPDYRRDFTLKLLRKTISDDGETSYQVQHVVNDTLKPDYRYEQLGSRRPDRIEIEIRNGDDAELAELQFEWYSDEQILLVEGATLRGRELEILYGNSDARPPRYGLQQYFHKFDGHPWGSFTVGAEAANPRYASAAATQDWKLFFKRSAAWLIAFAALVLVVFAWRMFRALENEPDESAR